MKTQTTGIRKEILGALAPAKAQDPQFHDKNCPFTGTLAVKKETLTGKIVKKDTNKSATIELFRSRYVPKYERYEVVRSRIRVHNPPAIDAQIGDEVVVARTRPLSKTKNHVIIQILTSTEGSSSEETKSEGKEKKSKGKKSSHDQSEEGVEQ